MVNNRELSQSLVAIKNVEKSNSWFRDSPQRWPQASLPLVYAVASVEVVSKSSDKAGAIYQQIIEAWGKPGIQAIYEKIISEVPDSEKEKGSYYTPLNLLQTSFYLTTGQTSALSRGRSFRCPGGG
jgi:hypothetical protein